MAPANVDKPFQAYGHKTRRGFYESMYVALKTERSSFDAHWRDIAQHMRTRRVRFQPTDRNRGDKRHQKILDNTGTFGLRTLSSGLHAGLTSPARPWFKLSTTDQDLNRFGPVKEWLHQLTEGMRSVFTQTNLYNSLPTVYGDIGGFGTAAAGLLPDTRDLFRAQTYPIGSYVLGMDGRGVVNIFMREYELTVFQVVEQFGGEGGGPAVPGQPIDWTNISTAVKGLWEQGEYEASVNILWVVAPNPRHKPESQLSQHFQFESLHFERGAVGAGRTGANVGDGNEGHKILRVSGFKTFPIVAPRWDVTGEDTYGTDCPGMIVLGDVRQLMEMQRKAAQALQKLVDPPLVGPVALKTQKTSLLPGDVTYVDVREGMQGLRSIHEININFEHLTFAIFDVQSRIRKGLYEDLFLMLATRDPRQGLQPPTAREIEERHEEKLLALGPVLERTNDELLDPLIDRTFSMMLDAGIVPPIPQELEGRPLKVEYVSIMAQAQKLVGVVSQDRFLQTMVPLMDFFPELRHKIRVFQFTDNYAEMLGVDPRAVVENDEAESAQQAEEQAARAAQAAEIAKNASTAAANAAQVPTPGGSNALQDLTSVLGVP